MKPGVCRRNACKCPCAGHRQSVYSEKGASNPSLALESTPEEITLSFLLQIWQEIWLNYFISRCHRSELLHSILHLKISRNQKWLLRWHLTDNRNPENLMLGIIQSSLPSFFIMDFKDQCSKCSSKTLSSLISWKWFVIHWGKIGWVGQRLRRPTFECHLLC